MNSDTILTKAIRILRRKKYDKAINMLLPEVTRYDGVFSYYYTLAIAYLRTNAFNIAFTYFKRAKDEKIRDPLALLGLAVLYLRRGETDRAVNLYLEIKDIDEHNRIASKALKIIRKYSGTEQLAAWVNSKRLVSLFPPMPSAPPSMTSRILTTAACVLAALSLSGGLLVRFDVLQLPAIRTAAPRIEREGFLISALNSEELDNPVKIDGSYRFILTRNEVFNIYEEARTRFTEHRDEAARRSLNKLLESNASESIKSKARLLMSFMEIPGFDNLKDRFSFAEVISDPLLYRDCFVIWRGMAANLEIMQNSTAFNLLVGYDTRSTLEGIVPVIFDFSVSVNTEQPLEVLGRVVPIVTDRGIDIKIEGIALHQSTARLRAGI